MRDAHKIQYPGAGKPRAPAAADDPRQSTPPQEIESSTRTDRATDQATERPTGGRHTLPMSAFSGCSSSPAQLKSGSASATTASETAAGRLGHRTGMPAAPDAAAPASAAASGRQRSCKGSAMALARSSSRICIYFKVMLCFQRHTPPPPPARQCSCDRTRSFGIPIFPQRESSGFIRM